jgi:hypothetical protein
MNIQNDPILNLLLDNVTEQQEREAIMTAHATFQEAGPTSLPGAIAIYISRLIRLVANLVAKLDPSANQTEKLRGDIARLSERDLPQLLQVKEEIVQLNLNTRSLRMGAVIAWVLLALFVGCAGGGYATYLYSQPTPGEARAVELYHTMKSQGVYLVLAHHLDGQFGVAVTGEQAYTQAKKVNLENQNCGVEIWWPIVLENLK